MISVQKVFCHLSHSDFPVCAVRVTFAAPRQLELLFEFSCFRRIEREGRFLYVADFALGENMSVKM